MNQQPLKNSQDPVVVIESLMAQEREDLEEHRSNASAATEPRLRTLFARLVDIHSGIYAELRSMHEELKSRNVITEQINDMFR
jgi:rubrerythrin